VVFYDGLYSCLSCNNYFFGINKSFYTSITMAQIGKRLSNGNPNSGLSSTANTYFTIVNGTIHSTHNNENGTWLLSGKWSNTLASILGHY
jgi:hypothetical protein